MRRTSVFNWLARVFAQPARVLPWGILLAVGGLPAEPQYAPYGSHDNQQTVRCESDNNRERSCRFFSGGGVRLLRQLSQSPCIEGQTWGYDGQRIWVRQGCRGQFAQGSGYSGSQEPYGQYQAGQAGQAIRCESINGRWRHCTMDSRGDVQLVRQLSDSSCVQGRDWNRDQGGIWVANGCRAEFRSLGYGAWPPSQVMRCESQDNRYNDCPADVRGGVRLLRQLSGSPCIEGRTWGADRNGVWVDNGCRADFEVGFRANDGFSWSRYRQGGVRYPDSRYGYGQTVRCESTDNRTRRCGAAIRGGARMLRQLSDTRCSQGYNWGWDGNGIWVSGGCRADFQVW